MQFKRLTMTFLNLLSLILANVFAGSSSPLTVTLYTTEFTPCGFGILRRAHINDRAESTFEGPAEP